MRQDSCLFSHRLWNMHMCVHSGLVLPIELAGAGSFALIPGTNTDSSGVQDPSLSWQHASQSSIP